MTRFVRWASLTPEERRQVDPAFLQNTGGNEVGNLIRSHICSVTLPNRKSCPVEYTRYGARSHRFVFKAPAYRTLWHSERVGNEVAAIAEKAQTLAPLAFKMAQQAEQKEAKRRTPPPGWHSSLSNSTLTLKAKTANGSAGRYTACIQFQSGSLLPIGSQYDEPEKVTQELAEGKYANLQLHGAQKLVIGLCSRWERRWNVAEFVVYPVTEEPKKVPPPEETTGSTEKGSHRKVRTGFSGDRV